MPEVWSNKHPGTEPSLHPSWWPFWLWLPSGGREKQSMVRWLDAMYCLIEARQRLEAVTVLSTKPSRTELLQNC